VKHAFISARSDIHFSDVSSSLGYRAVVITAISLKMKAVAKEEAMS